MLSKSTIGDWTEQRLAQFVQSLPAVQRRKDNVAAPTGPSGSSGGGDLPSPAAVDDAPFWNGFVWIAGKVTAGRMTSGASAAGTVATADGAGLVSYAAPALAAGGATRAFAFFTGG